MPTLRQRVNSGDEGPWPEVDRIRGLSEAQGRIRAALLRIDDLATMDDPDEMVACISDVEAVLKGERV